MVDLTGTVEGIIYRNDENGYTVFVMSVGDNIETVTGTFPLLREGDFITVHGLYTEHDSYGTQFKATQYEICAPKTADEIENYLASGIVRGIGPKLARDIVDFFGTDSLKIIESAPEKLREVPGIGRKKAKQISESYSEIMGAQQAVMFLQKYGITPNAALKIYAFYGDNTVSLLQQNPYRLVNDIEGIGFLTADKLASAMGLSGNSRFRICACVRYCLTEAGNEGHTFLPENILCSRAAALLLCNESEVKVMLPSFAAENSIMMRASENITAVYHPAFFYAEALCAGGLLLLRDSVESACTTDIEREIDAYQKEKKIVLAKNQRDAAISAIKNGISVITGGPGTGKTTTLGCILHLLHKRGQEIALCAPTGRAAKRMSAATGEDAKTIHRLLEYTKTENGFIFKRNKDHPVDCSVCIVDEASMIDIFLMQALLDGLKRGTRLIIVGDSDQLPSVGAGNVLGDIISSGVFPVVALNEVFRQASESTIVTNAHRINRGEMPVSNTPDGDFFFLRRYGESDIAQTVADLCKKRLPSKYGIDPISDVQVLTPIKKSACGVIALNKTLQETLNPPGYGLREQKFGDDIFREGDKVMQIKNNYDREWTQTAPGGHLVSGSGIFNGDCGLIREIDTVSRKITVSFDDDRISEYAFADISELNLAYALSVHKSQGCEFRFVIIPLPVGNMRIMTRNLFYTAVTRASEMVVVCGAEDTMAQMIANTDTKKRYSALALRLKSAAELL